MNKYIPPTAQEIHSFGIGLMDGISFSDKRYDKIIDIAQDTFVDVRNEPHYYRTGYFITQNGKWVLGTLLGVTIF